MTITVIRNADWAIAWDEAAKRHVYKRGIDVAFDGNTVTHVGSGYAGRADRTVDGRHRMVMPGLIDIHSHPGREPAYRGIREEHGVPGMHMTGLYERSQAYSADDDEMRASCAEFAYCELLKCGVTSLVDIGSAGRVVQPMRRGLPTLLATIVLITYFRPLRALGAIGLGRRVSRALGAAGTPTAAAGRYPFES